MATHLRSHGEATLRRVATPREPPATSPSARAPWTAIGAVVVLTASVVAVFARVLGLGSALFALEFHFVLMTGAYFVGKLAAPRLAGRRFEVSAAEVRLYERLGVHAFRKLLRRSGWTAAMRDARVFDGTRRTLASYEYATRAGENAHLAIFVLAVGMALLALFTGEPGGALWLVGLGIPLHVYPILLQRTQRARLLGLLARQAAS